MSIKWGSAEWFLDKVRSQGVESPTAYFGHAASGYQAFRHARLQYYLRSAAAGALHGPVLDIGCGTGELVASIAAEHGLHPVIGVDFIEPVVRAAAARHRQARFGVMALPPLGFATGTFGLVIASEVLYYLGPDDRKAALAEIARVTRPGGWLLFTSAMGDAYFTAETAHALLSTEFTVTSHWIDRNALYHRLMSPFTTFASASHHIYGGSASMHERLVGFARRHARWLHAWPVRVAARGAFAVSERMLASRALPRACGAVSRMVPAMSAPSNVTVLARRGSGA